MKVLRTLLAALGLCLFTACVATEITAPDAGAPAASQSEKTPGIGSGG